MCNQLSYFIFSILILLSLPSTSLCNIICSNYDITCGTYPNYWCCSTYIYDGCGSSTWSCYSLTTRPSSTPSPNISPGILAFVIVIPFFCFIVCACAGVCSRQRLRSSIVSVNSQRVIHPYGQQSIQRPARVVRVRPVYNESGAPPIPSIYEAPPPTYEAATAYDHPPKYQSAPVTSMVEQTNVWV